LDDAQKVLKSSRIGDLYKGAKSLLDSAGIENARREVMWMLEEVAGKSGSSLLASPETVLQEGEARRFRDMIDQRMTRVPLQYVVGHADFYDLRLHVGPGVLIPRPETELLVERCLDLVADTHQPLVIDVGTGSGCIALAIAKHRPDARVVAFDTSEAALEIASRNVLQLGLSLSLLSGDVLRPDFASEFTGVVDLLVSNPPYVPLEEAEAMQPEVVHHEPHEALFAGIDPFVFYRSLAFHSQKLLSPGAWVVVEIHSDGGAEVRKLFAAAGLEDVSVSRDYSGRDRIVAGRRSAEP
jgi:release factor glutamine methyltransferase